ncbi:hypothetical protein ACIPT4_07920 [Pectobacterium jejuense]|uniref:hypothetical protein n=1 Tax=Pectobacterium jejuense TaxID=2974022 RepID=UPI0038008BF5
MTWQGVPFRILDHKTSDYISIALSSIPKISIESPPDYTGPLITALAALVGGLVPSYIAWRTFRRNAENTKKERVEQQEFLKKERTAQQSFLINERDAQFRSVEKDREIQLKIAKKNFNMQVLSANRQQWINNLRDLIAEFMSLAPSLFNAQMQFILAQNMMNSFTSRQVRTVAFNDIKKERDELSDKLGKCIDCLISFQEKERLLVAKIKMMLNPKESSYGKINIILERINTIYNGYIEHDINNYSKLYTDMISEISNLLDASQEVLKTEWERVKAGV